MRFRSRCGTEKERAKGGLAHHALQFPEGEQGQKSAKDEDCATEQVVNMYLAKRPGDIFSMHQMLDHFLKKMERKDQQAKHKCFPSCRKKQSLFLELPAHVYGFSDENHLSDDKCVDQSGAISEI